MSNDKTVLAKPNRIRQIVADPDAQPIVLEDVKREMGMAGPHVPAEQLIDHTLTIFRAKPFMSSFDPDRDAWFVVAKDHETNAQITTVIGGGACTEILEGYAAAGSDHPLTVTLRQVQGGRYGRYYTFE